MGDHDTSHRLRRARFHGVTTELAPPAERFDYWRALFPTVTMTPGRAPRDGAYRAGGVGCGGDDGVVFADLGCDPICARYREGDSEHVRLSIITGGHVRITHGNDRRDMLVPGAGISLLDTSRALTADAPEGFRCLHLELPRALVHETIGSEPFAGDEALHILPDTPLSLVLKAQLTALARHGADMDADETAAAMQAVSGLVLTCLRRFNPCDEGAPAPADDALFAAACRYVDHRKDDSGLTADDVARALGCSRARLYRVFERRGLGVGEHIRVVRLNHGRSLLRAPSLSVGEISFRCGYADQSAFGKAFRRQFGVSPRDWRMALHG